MSIRKIIEYPDAEVALRTPSKPVQVVNRRVKKLVRDLKETLLDRPEGVGLAAVQVNEHLRVFVVRLGGSPDGKDDAGPPMAMINAQIVEARDEEKGFDGCLSVPGLFGDTMRPNYIRVQGLNEWGKPFDETYEGFDAVVIHHEIDHTDGVLFLDRIKSPEDLYTIQEDENGELIKVPLKISAGKSTKTTSINYQYRGRLRSSWL